MTLDELFQNGPAPESFPTLILEIGEELLAEAGITLEESEWRESHVSGIKYRVDPARPEMRQKRHVHVAAEKHVKSPAKQASWNDDASRHDRKSFNTALGARRAYQEVARTALGLADDVVLEAAEPDQDAKITILLEGSSEAGVELRFRAYRKLKTFKEFWREKGTTSR